MLGHFDHPGCKYALRTVERGERFGKLRHVSAYRGFFLDQYDFMTAVGYIKSCLYPSNAAADNERFFGHGHFYRVERTVAFHLFHLHADQIERFFSRGVAFFMHPRAMFSDIGYLAHIRVHTCFGTSFSECRLVHARRTGGNHYPVEAFFAYGILYHRLSGIGTHILVVDADLHAFYFGGFGRNFLTIHRSAYVLAAVAYEYSYF